MAFCNNMQILFCIAAWMSILAVSSANESCKDELPAKMASHSKCKLLIDFQSCSSQKVIDNCAKTLGAALGTSNKPQTAKKCKNALGGDKNELIETFCMTSCNGCVDGGWSDWGEWSECPVSCGGANNTRTRACDNPSPENGGADCVGDASETGRCNENPCPIDGGWGDWGEWSECPVSCGGANNTRTRACDNPSPDHGGADCVGDASETGRCKENPCPANCTDGIQNGDEEGVDCGGTGGCPACPTCTDGIQNGNELGIDCGGIDCPACTTPTRRPTPIWTTYREVGCTETYGSAVIEDAILTCVKNHSCYAVEQIGTKGHYCKDSTSYLETKFVGRINLKFKRDGVVWIKDSCDDEIMNQRHEVDNLHLVERGIDCGGICGNCTDDLLERFLERVLQLENICTRQSETACEEAAIDAANNIFDANAEIRVMLGKCDLDGIYNGTDAIKDWLKLWGLSIAKGDVRSESDIRNCDPKLNETCNYSNEYILSGDFDDQVEKREHKATARFHLNSNGTKVFFTEFTINIVTSYIDNSRKFLANEIGEDELINIFTTTASLTAPYFDPLDISSPPINREFSYPEIPLFFTGLKVLASRHYPEILDGSLPIVPETPGTFQKCDSHYHTDCHYQFTFGFLKFNFIGWLSLSSENGKIEKAVLHSRKAEDAKCPLAAEDNMTFALP